MLRLLMVTVAGDPRTEYPHLDSVGEYINSTFATDQRPVFIRVPAGYVPASKTPVVLRLNIYLYGPVESTYQWYQTIAVTLNERGWTVGSYDCCFWRREGPAGPTYLILHVDDGMMVDKETDKVFKRLTSVYEIKHLDRPTALTCFWASSLSFHLGPGVSPRKGPYSGTRQILGRPSSRVLHAMPT
jgi:hypothetical protein